MHSTLSEQKNVKILNKFIFSFTLVFGLYVISSSLVFAQSITGSNCVVPVNGSSCTVTAGVSSTYDGSVYTNGQVHIPGVMDSWSGPYVAGATHNSGGITWMTPSGTTFELWGFHGTLLQWDFLSSVFIQGICAAGVWNGSTCFLALPSGTYFNTTNSGGGQDVSVGQSNPRSWGSTGAASALIEVSSTGACPNAIPSWTFFSSTISGSNSGTGNAGNIGCTFYFRYTATNAAGSQQITSAGLTTSCPSGYTCSGTTATPNNCTGTPWGTVSHGASVTGYISTNDDYCSSQSRTCSAGTLSGSYTATSCSLNNYTYNFNGNGATTNASPVSAGPSPVGTGISTPIAPLRTGFIFAGWSPGIPGTMPSGGGTSFAQWTLPIPTLSTPTSASITDTGATLGATITSNNGFAVTSRGTCWSTSTPNPTTNCVAEGGTAVSAFTQTRTGLPASTLIYYSGYAVNSQGTGYSTGSSFTTLADPNLCTGGTITTANGYNIHSFTTSGTFTCPVAITSVEYLVVGGGGAGGGSMGSGGGAGGMRTGTGFAIITTPYTITVGAGGTGVAGNAGNPGGNSIFSTITSLGGGGGTYYTGGANPGGAGGSGAGGHFGGAGGAGTGGQGNNGGAGLASYYASAGGGGAGGVGGNSTTGAAGNGGLGLSSSITGSSVIYAGGGGGGWYSGQASVAGTGGSGIGGNGEATGINGTGGSGAVNTGSGGGGAGYSAGIGGAGGGGVVVIRYIPISPGTTTLATGVDPSSVSVAPGGSATFVNSFTLQTNIGTDVVSQVQVAMTNASSTRLVEITNDAGSIVYGSSTNPTGSSISISLNQNTLTASSSLVQYKIRVTPKTQVNLPVGDILGVEVPVTATISNWTSSKIGKVGSDSTSATVTIDNKPPTVQGDPATSWILRTSSVNNNWTSVTYGNNLFVAVANTGTGNRAMTSPDGVTWTTRTTPFDTSWNDIVFGNGLFVAVGESIFGRGVMTSPDGTTWTLRTTARDNNWTSVTFGNGMFVAVASTGNRDRVMTSPDGFTWTSRATPNNTNAWTHVAFGNGTFVAVSNTGAGNRAMRSTDGINWTMSTTPVDNNWTSVTYGSGLFVAVANSGTGNRVMTSPDGVTWTARTSAADNSWTSVIAANGSFVAVANSGTGNRVMFSFNGITWSTRFSASDNNWRGIAQGNNTYVAVSNLQLSNLVMTSVSSALTITSGAASTVANFIPSGETDLQNIMVLYSTAPITFVPTDGLTYNTNDVVVAGTIVGCIDSTPTPLISDSCTISGLTNGTLYYFRIYARDTNGNFSTGAIPQGSIINPNIVPAITQSSFRFFASSTTAIPGASMAAQDTFAVIPNGGDAFRMRMTFRPTSNPLGLNARPLKLQYAVKSGTCDGVFSGESYADVTNSSPIAFFDTQAVADGAAIGSQADMTGSTIVDQAFVKSGIFSNTQAIVPTGQDAKFDFSLYDNNAPSNTAYCLRAVNADGTILNSYTTIPEIKTATQQIQVNSFRFRKDDGNDSLATYLAAENTAVTSGTLIGDKIRLRFVISNQSAAISTKAYQLEYSSGTCTTWSTVPRIVDFTTQPWRLDTSSYVADNLVTSALGGLTAPGGKVWKAGRLQTFNNTTYPITLAANEYSQIEYSLRSTASALPYTTYCFRISNNGDASDVTLTSTPQITLIPTAFRMQGGGGGVSQSAAQAVTESATVATTTVTGGTTGASATTTATSTDPNAAPPAAQQSTTTPSKGGGGGDSGFLNVKWFALNTLPNKGTVLGDSTGPMCTNMTHKMLYGATDATTQGEVSELQYFLKTKGYFNAKVTGVFGRLTEEAVKQYQKDNTITPTGIVGWLTRTTMTKNNCVQVSRNNYIYNF